tara:strand:+ start:518 stop:793 length:276 start_codon:yes stop_codon:yes gene_type:complete
MFKKDILKKAINNKLFSVEFIKADKTKRTMLCKLPTNEKFFAGGELKGNRDHLLEVIDVTILRKTKEPRKAWRSINLNTLTSLKIGGIEWI